MSWPAAVGGLQDSVLSAFGEEILFTPSGSPPFSVRAIFTEHFITVDPETGTQVSTQQPVLGVKLSEFSIPPADKDRVTVRGVQYKIVDIQRDGEGGARLFLHMV